MQQCLCVSCRAPWGQVAEAVKKLDTAVLSSAEDARAVLACAPAADERKMFEAFLCSGGCAEALSDAERFCLELMQVWGALLLLQRHVRQGQQTLLLQYYK